MFYMYILQSSIDKDLYVGSTNNLQRRFKEHNAREVLSTKARKPLALVYYEAYQAENDARNREHQLKLRGQAMTQLKRRIKNSLLQNQC